MNQNDGEFPQMNVRHQTTDPENSENTSRINAKKTQKTKTNKNYILILNIMLKIQKVNDKKISKTEEKNHLTDKESRTIILLRLFSETTQVRIE